ncbi:hypothetical protein RO3G_11149 [Rhizopus delemar RA 99-880]|uniref:Uncharacterized protein n=1 Tax=Rhizopus delemar (strain RA 99-880 / ATCC MYA-4621 / FGSC 9543 / NRRL 43880) TaxID=246409 RepID=I1CDA8_RHIO9|nr:hypothetical protein RO3G_11149 [Rhizopus delemar RA 99-880]|eukprot:EIE86438.1 hypothetical protein RO3G_11149 [Rhizopus delemar RA 99-880]
MALQIMAMKSLSLFSFFFLTKVDINDHSTACSLCKDHILSKFVSDRRMTSKKSSLQGLVQESGTFKSSCSQRPLLLRWNDTNKNIVKDIILYWNHMNLQLLRSQLKQVRTTTLNDLIDLKSIEGVTHLNAKDYKISKEAVLVSINSNKLLEISKKFEKLHVDDLKKGKTFIKDTQKEIQDRSRIFSLLSLYSYKSKPVQIDEQAFWKIAKFFIKDKESIPKKATDNDLTTWYPKFFDFSKMDNGISNDKVQDSLSNADKVQNALIPRPTVSYV